MWVWYCGSRCFVVVSQFKSGRPIIQPYFMIAVLLTWIMFLRETHYLFYLAQHLVLSTYRLENIFFLQLGVYLNSHWPEETQAIPLQLWICYVLLQLPVLQISYILFVYLVGRLPNWALLGSLRGHVKWKLTDWVTWFMSMFFVAKCFVNLLFSNKDLNKIEGLIWTKILLLGLLVQEQLAGMISWFMSMFFLAKCIVNLFFSSKGLNKIEGLIWTKILLLGLTCSRAVTWYGFLILCQCFLCHHVW